MNRYFALNLGLLYCFAIFFSAHADSVINGIFTPTPTNIKFPYIGNDDGWQERLEQIQGVRFLNAGGQVQEAFHTMANSGLNAVHVTVGLGQPLSLPPLTGSGSSNESLVSAFTLYANNVYFYGGVDLQVAAAKRARAVGMKVILTIDMGLDIPGPNHEPFGQTQYDHWQNDNYSQMLNNISAETIRLLDPFLQAGIQPDIIVAGDETDSGILDNSFDNHGTRTLGGPTGVNAYWTTTNLAASDVATGDVTVYPKFVGYVKAEIAAAKGEVQRYFPNTGSHTLYALHSKGGTPNYYYGRMFSSSPFSESTCSWDTEPTVTCTSVVNASQINSLPSLPNLVDVVGTSCYFNTPTDGSQDAFVDAFVNQGNNEAPLSFVHDLENWGLQNNLSADGTTYVSGTYAGEHAKKWLILETSTGTTWKRVTTTPNGITTTTYGTISLPTEQQFVNYIFQQLALPQNDNLVLGAMWWEGEYTEFNHDYSLFLFNPGTFDHQASIILPTWGHYGQSTGNTAPIVNFQASTIAPGVNTWTDSSSGVTAAYAGSNAPVANGTSVTPNGGFQFNTLSVPGLDGLTSYTLAVGFTATSLTSGGSYYYGGNGLFGADIPGAGQGDPGLSLTTDSGGQIIAGSGVDNTLTGGGNNGFDLNLYDPQLYYGNYGGNFVTGAATGAVLVVNGSGGNGQGSMSLYVNGQLVDQVTGLTINPLGSNNGTVQSYNFGVGAQLAYGGGLMGTISQAQIYNNSLSPSAAASLSSSIASPSLPTPLVNFQASDFTGGNTWADRSSGSLATYVGGSAPSRNASGAGCSVTTNGGFQFNTSGVPGLGGLTTYTLAVGFTATSVTSGGPNYYAGNGLFGTDIPGAGQGDPGLSLTTDSGGQIIAGSGVNDTNTSGGNNGYDLDLYDPQLHYGNYGGNFVTGSPTGAVMVVDGSGGAGQGIMTLYVNGKLIQQATGLTINPLGSNNGTVQPYNFGLGAQLANGGVLVGNISQAQIYGNALTPGAASFLSSNISALSTPAP